MESIKTVEDFREYMKKNHDIIYSRILRAEDISFADEWMKEDVWDDIYQREKTRLEESIQFAEEPMPISDIAFEIEEQRYGRNKNTLIDHTYINSGHYRKKFDKISDSAELNRLLYKLAKGMLEHRSGTRYEDMYWLDPLTNIIVASETDSQSEEEILYSDSTIRKIKAHNHLITIHSHPNSFPPSISDLNSNYVNNYDIGIVVCHDGKVFIYSAGQEINEQYYQITVEENLKNGYNDYEAQVMAMNDMQTKFDILCKEVTDDDS